MMEVAGGMNKEKVRIDIALEKRGALFFPKLYQKGFEPGKNTVRIKEGKINYVAEGLYPGGQKTIEKDIQKIKDEIDPVEFDFQIDCSDTECKKIEEQLKEKELIIIKDKGRICDYRVYILKFDGGLEEATSRVCEIDFPEFVSATNYQLRAN